MDGGNWIERRMKGITKLNITEENDYVKLYGKINGWALCRQLGLPTFSKMYVISDYIDESDETLLDIFGTAPLLCRTDAPWGYGNSLPRGRNITIFQINSFLEKVKECTTKGVLLICIDPYKLNTNQIIPRYKIDGGIFVLFEFDRIIIEHVGRGFDVGDLTRGKSVHNRIIIPISMLYEKPYEIFKYSKINFPNNFYSISVQDYNVEKMNREKDLVEELSEQGFSLAKSEIPNNAQPFTLNMFKKVYTECIEKVIYSGIVIERPFGIMMNVYNNNFCVFEIWQKKRSLSVKTK